jgi:hypothetical protein
MTVSTTLILGATILLGQLAQCMLSSRCTEINTPCLSMKRDVLPAEEVLRQQHQQPQANAEGILEPRNQL